MVRSSLTLTLLLWFMLLGCSGPPARDGAEFRVGLEDTPGTLDPRYAADAHAVRILPLLFHSLLVQEPDGRFRLDLAEAWDTPDPRTHVFRLRSGVKFHDGSVLTARDVVATYRYLMDPAHGCPASGALKAVAAVEASDERTVVFRLGEAFVSFPFQLTLGILPERLASSPDLGDKVVGTGPYRVSSFKPGEEVTLEAFSEHFGGPPGLARLKFRIVSNATTRLLEIESGGLDLLQNAVPPYSVKFLRRRAELDVLVAPGSSYQYLVYNCEDPILKDVRVRRAISYAIDRELLISFALQGLARLATGLLPPEHWAYSGRVPTYPYDPARAKELLDEAGFRDPDGDGPSVRFTLSYKTSTDKTVNEVAQVIADQLRKVGVGVEVRSLEWGTFFSDVKKGSFQIASLRWIGMSDPDSFHVIFHSSSVPPAGANRGRYRSVELDPLLDESRAEPNEKKRRELYARIQEIVARDCAYTSLWWLDNVVVLRKGFRGFQPLPGGEYTSLAAVAREAAP